MCATGFLCQAAGIPAARIDNVRAVDTWRATKSRWPWSVPHAARRPQGPRRESPQGFEWPIPVALLCRQRRPAARRRQAGRDAGQARNATEHRAALHGEALPGTPTGSIPSGRPTKTQSQPRSGCSTSARCSSTRRRALEHVRPDRLHLDDDAGRRTAAHARAAAVARCDQATSRARHGNREQRRRAVFDAYSEARQ